MKALVILLLLLLQSCVEIMPPTLAAPKEVPPVGKPIEGDSPVVEENPGTESSPEIEYPESSPEQVVVVINEPEVAPMPSEPNRSPAVEPEVEVVVEEMEPIISSPEVSQPIPEEVVVPDEVTIVEPEPVLPIEELFPKIPLVSSSLIATDTKPIVSLFVFYAGLFNKPVDWSNLIIEIEQTSSSSYIAYCSRVNNNQNPKITVNGKFWVALNSTYKEQLLFHELGHCLLNRSHLGNNYVNPTSIMNTSLFSDQMYKSSYDYFLKELFSSLDTHSDSQYIFGENYQYIK